MARATVQRSEQVREPHVLEYGGEEYKLPASLPLTALEAMEDNKVIAFLQAVFGDQWGRFSRTFDTNDLEVLADAVTELYGGAAKPSASGAS